MQSGIKLPAYIACLFLLTILPAPELRAQQSEAPKWQDWSILLGEWTGTGNGQLGQGTGKFTFKPDLQRRILMRTNYAEYPATKEKPGFRHDDLMVVYLLSEPTPGEPTYRLTYIRSGPDALSIRFEVAPPDKPDQFQTYIEASAKRTGQ